MKAKTRVEKQIRKIQEIFLKSYNQTQSVYSAIHKVQETLPVHESIINELCLPMVLESDSRYYSMGYITDKFIIRNLSNIAVPFSEVEDLTQYVYLMGVPGTFASKYCYTRLSTFKSANSRSRNLLDVYLAKGGILESRPLKNKILSAYNEFKEFMGESFRQVYMEMAIKFTYTSNAAQLQGFSGFILKPPKGRLFNAYSDLDFYTFVSKGWLTQPIKCLEINRRPVFINRVYSSDEVDGIKLYKCAITLMRKRPKISFEELTKVVEEGKDIEIEEDNLPLTKWIAIYDTNDVSIRTMSVSRSSALSLTRSKIQEKVMSSL